MKMNRINCLNRIVNFNNFYTEPVQAKKDEKNKVKPKNSIRKAGIDPAMVKALDNILEWLIVEKI